MNTKVFNFIVIFLILSVSFSKAQWIQTSGPYGGKISSFTSSGSNLFAGTGYFGSGGAGVFRSTNNGSNWNQVNNGLTNNTVLSLASSGSNLFAGTNDGVFRSTDNGTSWAQVNNGLPDYCQAISLLISGSDLFVGSNGQVYRTTNNGSNWFEVFIGLPSYSSVYAMAVSGTNIFIGTTNGVFRSTNNGSSWTQINTGLTNLQVHSMTTIEENIFVGTDNCVFISTDNGLSWNQVNNGMQIYSQVYSLEANGLDLFAGTVQGKVYYSNNHGSSWTDISNSLSGSQFFSLFAFNSNIFAGTNSGVSLTSNNGTNWQQVNNGIINTEICSMINNGTHIFAATNGSGIFRSTNNGTNWTQVNTGLPYLYVQSLAVSGSVLFAGSEWFGVYTSINNGESWIQVNNGITNPVIQSLAVLNNNIFAGSNGGEIYRSTDNGANWMQVNIGMGTGFIFCFTNLGVNLFAGTNNGIYRSSNNGSSWVQVNTGLTNLGVQTLAVSGTRLFAGTYNGVFTSSNNGSYWTPVNSGITNLNIQKLISDGTNLFAGTGSGGIFISMDNGLNWYQENDGLTDNFIRSLLVSDSKLLAGTFANGVWSRPIEEMSVPRKTPVIFIPGIMGTALYDDVDPNDNHLTENERIWFNKSNIILYGEEFLDVLQLDLDGINPLNIDYNIKAAPLRNDPGKNLEYQYGGFWPGRMPFAKYKGFFEGLINNQFKIDDGDLDDTEGENLYCFTYDWRKSIIYNANLLNQFIDDIKSRTNSNQVNIVAHSMGGMVAKECIKAYGSDRIKKLIFVGTPHLGSPKILYSMLSGDLMFDGINWAINRNQIQKISLNMPSTYLLFPNEKYRDTSLNNGISYNANLYSNCFWHHNIACSYFNTQQYFNETILPYSRTFNTFLLNQAHIFQQHSLEVNYGQIEIYNIVGSATPTIGYVFDYINGVEHRPNLWFNLTGDGTVPLKSAEVVSLSKKIANYYIDGVEHSDLPSHTQVVSIIVDLLKEPAITNFNAPPYTYGATILQIQASCPVELHAYDSQNRHTGPTSDSTWVTEIPGSFYDSNNLADTTSPKFILLQPGESYSIKLISQNTTSKFDLSLNNIVLGQNTLETSFIDIPLQPNTIASCSLDSLTEDIELNIDWDGNGITDTVISPTILTDLSNNSINKLPSHYYLQQNYPNPFNPVSTIKYQLPKNSQVQIKVYDILGKEVAELVNEEKQAGYYEVEFNGSNLASGVYFYRIQAGNFVDTKKMILLK